MDISKPQIALFGLLLAAGVFYSTSPLLPQPKETRAEEIVIRHEIKPERYFQNLQIEGRAAYVYDLQQDRILYATNENVPLPLASLTKVMTALNAYENAGLAGNDPQSATVTISKESLAQEGDSGLYWLEKWKLKDLLDFTLLVSSNDGAAAVAHAFNDIVNSAASSSADVPQGDLVLSPFVQAMNAKAKEIGLTQTHFVNETGLDQTPNISGGYGTARDIGTLFTYIYKNRPELFEATRHDELSFQSLSNMSHRGVNTNKIVSRIPYIIGSKTGYTDLAGGNLAIILDVGIGRPVVIVVMGSTIDGRFTDVEILTQATLEYVAGSKPQAK